MSRLSKISINTSSTIGRNRLFYDPVKIMYVYMPTSKRWVKINISSDLFELRHRKASKVNVIALCKVIKDTYE